MKFEELNLLPILKQNLQKNGFVSLTPIQEKAIAYGLEGKDLTGLAQTGTGKTLAFLIPLINKLLNSKDEIQKGPNALILAPTRELVMQIHEEAMKLIENTELKLSLVIGGTGYKEQEDSLRKANIIVASPGRLIDHIKNKSLSLQNVKFFVLDEADRMFDMGFIKDIRFLMKKCSEERQVMLFSATLSYYVIRLASDYLKEPVEIQIEPEKITTDNIEQKLIHLGRDEKIPYLINLILHEQKDGLGIIFTNLKVMVPDIVNSLRKYGIPATGISSLLDQKKRVRLLKEFKIGKYQIMVATDVASRGLDIDDIGIVYNYDLPGDTENYVHRIGRTARAGRTGISISFCSERDYEELEKIEKLLGKKLDVIEVNENYLKYPDTVDSEFTEFMPGTGRRDRDKEQGRKSRRPMEKRGFRENRKPQRESRHPHPGTRQDKKPTVRNTLEEAETFLKKAEPFLGNEKKKADGNQRHKKGKFPDHRGGRKKPDREPHSSKTGIKENNYDKSKRNLFDINDSKDSQKQEKTSIWKKIKSIFGS